MNIDYDIVPDSTAFLVAAVLLAFATEYLVTQAWKSFHPLPASKGGTGDETLGLQATFLFGAVKSIQISARVYLVLLVLEYVLERFPYLDQFRTDEKGSSVQIHKAAPGVALTVWMGMTLCTVKRIIFLQMVSGRKLGRMVLVDRLVDFVVFLIMGTNILEILKLDVSVGLQSVLSAGGIGALMFSLASKDFAENIIGGISLNAWDAVNVGDKVRIGNGIEGTIMEIGLLETIIQGYDDIVTRIPNAQLTRTRISNLSRVKKSRVKQNLRFKYRDLDSIPQVLEEIKQEIRLSCPEVRFYVCLCCCHDLSTTDFPCACA